MVVMNCQSFNNLFYLVLVPSVREIESENSAMTIKCFFPVKTCLDLVRIEPELTKGSLFTTLFKRVEPTAFGHEISLWQVV